MKDIFLLFLGIIFINPLFAQKNLNSEDDMQTIFGNGKFTSGGYGATELKYTRILNQDALMLGGRGGWIINQTFSIGGGGYGLITSHEVPDYIDSNYLAISRSNRPYYLRVGWGGIFLQYTHSSNSLIHFTVNSLIGAGGANCTPSLNQMEEDEKNKNIIAHYEGSGFFIFEPGIGVEVNIFKFFRIELGGSYRLIAGLDMPVNPKTNTPYMESKDLGNWAVNLAFKFGKF